MATVKKKAKQKIQRTPSQRGRHSKQKGRRGELDVAAALSAVAGVEINARLGQARDGGSDLSLDGSPHVFGFCIEVKRKGSTPTAGDKEKWWKQVCAAANSSHPVVLWRTDREKGWHAIWRAYSDRTYKSMIVETSMDDWLAHEFSPAVERARLGQALAPKALAPKALAPKALAPKALAPKALAPEKDMRDLEEGRLSGLL